MNERIETALLELGNASAMLLPADPTSLAAHRPCARLGQLGPLVLILEATDRSGQIRL